MSNVIPYHLAIFLLRVYHLDVLTKVHVHICIKTCLSFEIKIKMSMKDRINKLWYVLMIEK